MIFEQDIRYLRRPEIDPAKWDACIHTASNGLIYAHSVYLDHMASGDWDGLVLGDYEAVMPLTWRQKGGIRYAYQPAFTQQLGIFSVQSPGPAQIEAFLSRLRDQVRFAEIFLNYKNLLGTLQPRVNFILDLNASYEQLAAGYKKDLIRNLKEASRFEFQYGADLGLSTALSIYKEHYGPRTPHVKEKDWRQFETLCCAMEAKGACILRVVRDGERKILATALFLVGKGRMHLLQSTNLQEGRDRGANHFLLDAVIREFCGRPAILDFEGSDLPGIAHFYANFGSRNEPYYFYRHNRLPWPLRWIK